MPEVAPLVRTMSLANGSRVMRNFLFYCFVVATLSCASAGQEANMAGMEMSDHTSIRAGSLVGEIEQHATSGTDVEPLSTSFPMLMWQKDSWTLMFHGEVFVNELQQNGPRG